MIVQIFADASNFSKWRPKKKGLNQLHATHIIAQQNLKRSANNLEWGASTPLALCLYPPLLYIVKLTRLYPIQDLVNRGKTVIVIITNSSSTVIIFWMNSNSNSNWTKKVSWLYISKKFEISLAGLCLRIWWAIYIFSCCRSYRRVHPTFMISKVIQLWSRSLIQ